ncbi:MAG: SDR family NAD(P)-dependent oxidoreductase [Deltaproteobacteria bacterium]|nr:SDR family NAD(P)-dependent oxidoreductase [Deltaproteobacteria bacterium]
MPYRTAFITGASSGIGRALAIRLAADGVHVALAARRQEALETLARDIERRGGQAAIYPLDVADPGLVEATLRGADEDLGGIDLVVANAGVGGGQRWSGELNYEATAEVISVNVQGALATLLALMDRMVERRRGHLVGISSLAQYRGLPRSATYSASKAFLSTFLEGLRVDLRQTGLAVTDVRPGLVATAMTAGNSHRMPFMVQAPEAAEIIVRGIEKRRPVVAFPWQLATVVRSAALLPPMLYDRAVTRAKR